MTYTTLMAHLETGRPNTGLLQIVRSLTERMDLHVTGIAAHHPQQISDGEGFAMGALLVHEETQSLALLATAEAEFRAALQASASSLEWRSDIVFDTVCSYLAREARCADLLVTGVASGALLETSDRASLGDLVMQLGRPILVVPDKARPLALQCVVVGWTDTREARRATLDALPLLRKARHVSLVEVADKGDMAKARARLEDVAVWMRRHGVAVEPLAAASNDNGASRLYDIASEEGADLIVAGAYGHGRLREWAFGGVTHDLLRRAECCSLISH